jgi:hypothetical protein
MEYVCDVWLGVPGVVASEICANSAAAWSNHHWIWRGLCLPPGSVANLLRAAAAKTAGPRMLHPDGRASEAGPRN